MHVIWTDLLGLCCCRLVEEADFRAAQELFGSDKTLDTLVPKCAQPIACFQRIDMLNAIGAFSSQCRIIKFGRTGTYTFQCAALICCRSAKDFEEFGRLVAGKYLVAHSRSPQYKVLLKTLFKAALAPLPAQVQAAPKHDVHSEALSQALIVRSSLDAALFCLVSIFTF